MLTEPHNTNSLPCYIPTYKYELLLGGPRHQTEHFPLTRQNCQQKNFLSQKHLLDQHNMEWAKDTYNTQYEKWVPWLEDVYLSWFTNDNKASYTARGKSSQTASLCTR